MSNHPITIGILLGIAVGLAIFCSIGLCIMRDAYQRLHFATPVVSISMLLIIIAVFIDNDETQARIKIIMIGVILFFMNAVLSHATARAIFIKDHGRWIPEPKDKIPVHEQDAFAGETKVRQ